VLSVVAFASGLGVRFARTLNTAAAFDPSTSVAALNGTVRAGGSAWPSGRASLVRVAGEFALEHPLRVDEFRLSDAPPTADAEEEPAPPFAEAAAPPLPPLPNLPASDAQFLRPSD
jgi:hypothetical protein